MGTIKHGDWFFDDDENLDYTNRISAAVAAGDLARAGYLEKSRNTKIDYYGMPYAKTYEYQDYIPEIGNKPGKKADASNKSYASDMSGIMSTIQNKKFSYNPESDALFKSIKDNYRKSAGLVTEDVLGQYAAMTGGMPSSYAVSAATSAGNQHMQKADDLIPELYQLAYGKFADEKADLYKQYGILADKEQQDYNRKVYDDETAYKREQDEAAAIASANEAQMENDRWWAEFYAEQTGEEYDRLSDSRKLNASLVFDMVESGNVPDDEMMAMAGINLSGQQFYDNYRSNYAWQLGQKSKYTKSSSVKNGDKELKNPTSTMYSEIDSLFEDGDGLEGLDKLKAKYDWDTYDEGKFDSYVNDYYVKGYSDPGFVSVDEWIKVINDTAMNRTQGSRLVTNKGMPKIISDGNGGYELSGGMTPTMVANILFESELPDEQVAYILDSLGIQEDEVR